MSKFIPGQSGNPTGRRKGSLDRRTQLVRELEDDLPALLQVLKTNALAGDTQALKLLLDRVLPLRKTSAELIEIPDMTTAKTLTQKVDVVLSAIADAQLPPDIGSQLISAIGTAARVEEVSELKDRLEALEQSIKRSKK